MSFLQNRWSWTFLCVLALSLSFTLSDELYVPYLKKNIRRKVRSSQILKRDKDDHCYFPGLCDIKTTKCNIPKVPLANLTAQTFFENYVSKDKPVIIQLCDPNKKKSPQSIEECLSQIIDNSTGLFRWNEIIQRVLPPQKYQEYVRIEHLGTPSERGKQCDVHPLEDRNKQVYGEIIQRIHTIPSLFEDLDMFNELIGYLSSVDGELLGTYVCFLFFRPKSESGERKRANISQQATNG